MEEIFENEIFIPRRNNSIVWSALFSLIFSFCTVFFLQTNILHPFSWISGIFSSTLYGSGIFCMLVICSLSVAVLLIHSRRYSTVPNVLQIWLDVVWHMVKLGQLGFVVAFCIFSTLTVGSLVMLQSAVEYKDFTMPCLDKQNKLCLNEKHFFIVMHGTFTGFVFAVLYVMEQMNYVAFPAEQQSKYSVFKGNLSNICLNSLVVTLKHLRWYFIFYYFIGIIIYGSLAKALNMEHSVQDGMFGSLLNLLDMKLLWTAWITGAFVHIVWRSAFLIFQIHQTEHVKFPIEGDPNQAHPLPMDVALNMSAKSSLLHILAYIDLCHVALDSPARRREVFTLSQPGGHPRNWNVISQSFLSLMDGLKEQLDKATYGNPLTAAPIVNGCSKQASGDAVKNPLLEFTLSAPLATEFMRKIQSTGYELVKKVKSWRPVAGVMGELSDYRIRKMFAECYVSIRAVDAISGIVAASVREDSHGTVQERLPQIICCLLELQKAMDKVPKVNPAMKRGAKQVDANDKDIVLRIALKNSVKQALYRIALAFRPYINNIGLSVEQSQRMTQFCQFKEF